MDIPVKRLKSGFELPVYGLGTWEMGGRMSKDSSNDAEYITAIENAIDRGITHIDTAEAYGDGHSEELVGEVIKNHDRSKLLIATKVSAWNQGYDDLRRSLANSLKRLQTDYVDLYLLHRYPQPGIDIRETMRALDELVAGGAIRHIGVCNLSVNRFIEAQKHTKNQIVCNQVHYSLDTREIVERGVLDHAQKNDTLIVAWGPLSKGALEKADILHGLAEKYDKTPYQIALNWLIYQDNVVTIPKTTKLEHLQENLGAIGWQLETEDYQKLTEEFPDQKLISDRVPLNYAASAEV